MRYKGKIGELKPVGFIVAVAIFIVIALFIYRRFEFVTEPTKEEAKSTIEQLDKRIDTLQQEHVELTKVLSQVEGRVTAAEHFQSRSKPKPKCH